MNMHAICADMKTRGNSWEFVLSFCRGFSGCQAYVRSAFARRTVLLVPKWWNLNPHLGSAKGPAIRKHVVHVPTFLPCLLLLCSTAEHSLNSYFLGPLYRRKMLCLLPWWESLGSWLERWKFLGGQCWQCGRHGLLPSQKRNDLWH